MLLHRAGVYLGGRFGMRVENIVCINERGETEVLNKADRSLRVLDWYKSKSSSHTASNYRGGFFVKNIWEL